MDLAKGFEFRTSSSGLPVLVRKGESWTQKPVESEPASSGAGDQAPEAVGATKGAREQDRLIESSKGRIESKGKVGGSFSEVESRGYYKRRHEMFTDLLRKQADGINRELSQFCLSFLFIMHALFNSFRFQTYELSQPMTSLAFRLLCPMGRLLRVNATSRRR